MKMLSNHRERYEVDPTRMKVPPIKRSEDESRCVERSNVVKKEKGVEENRGGGGPKSEREVQAHSLSNGSTGKIQGYSQVHN